MSCEIQEFDLMQHLNNGGIPRHYETLPTHIAAELDDYVSLYLKEEIEDEAVTRKLDGFSRFLDVMALNSGAIENFASDSQRKGITRSKFFLFDVGVTNYLAKRLPYPPHI